VHSSSPGIVFSVLSASTRHLNNKPNLIKCFSHSKKELQGYISPNKSAQCPNTIIHINLGESMKESTLRKIVKYEVTFYVLVII
jgi:hypothetical protein